MPNVSPPGGGPTIQKKSYSDFTGGLNLISDTFKLGANESPHMLNVDVTRRGGVQRRRAWIERSAMGQSKGFGLAEDKTISHLLWQQDNDTLWYWSGGTAVQLVMNSESDTATTASVVDPAVVASNTAWNADEMHWASYEGITYGTRGRQTTAETTVSYDPSGVSSLTDSSVSAMTDPATTTYQDDLDVPSGSHFPMCRYVATHQDLMWAAHTTESTVDHPSRIRWSHTGDAGSWRQNDWIDIDSHDGDEITAIAAFRDQLLVFKRNSVHAVFGYSADTFQVVQIAGTIGAVSQRAVAVNEQGAFFFDRDDGVYAYDGASIQWVFANLHPALEAADLENPELTTLAWLGRRLWVNCRWNGLTDEGRSFIFDPQVGSWTAYTGFTKAGVGAPTNHIRHAIEYSTDGWTVKPYAELAYTEGSAVSSLLEVDVEDTWTDVYTSGPASFTTKAVYKTAWLDAGDLSREKRWRRPEFVLSGGYEQRTLVGVKADWNGSTTVKTLELNTASAGGTYLWGGQTWAAMSWSEVADLYDIVVRGGSVGSTGRSLQFEFTAPQGNVWEMNAFTIKWRDKRMKG
jgi:hypothetical protein